MLGLVLEGGGTKGSYQIGVYEALVDEDIRIDGIAGTSIGSLNGALIVQGDYKKAKELWENIDYTMIVNATDEEIERISNLKLTIKDISFIGSKVKDLIRDRGLDITPLKEMLNEYIDEEKIRNSKKDFGIVTVNVSDFKPVEIFIEDIPKGKLKQYLLASSHLPIFKQEKMEGSYYLDGAFHDNLPFNMLKNKGYTKFILVRIFGAGIVKKIDLDEEDYIIIQPREDLGSSLECSPERSKYNMKLGYYDTLKVLRNLKGDKYYIKSDMGEYEYFRYFSELTEDEVVEIGKKFNLDNKSKWRLLFEEIVPKLASLMDLKNDYTYEDVFIKILELKADKLKIDRFKLYDIEELIELARTSPISEEKAEKNILTKIKSKVESIPMLNKEDIIYKVADILFK